MLQKFKLDRETLFSEDELCRYSKDLVDEFNPFNNGSFLYIFDLTSLGLIPVGTLPLAVFNCVQEPLIGQRLAYLEAAIFDNSGSVLALEELRIRLADLRIYGAQMRRILLASLYYLKVQTNGQVFYKIGITTRPMPKRLVEISRGLTSHYQNVEIEVLGTWANRANVERYFKYRYPTLITQLAL